MAHHRRRTFGTRGRNCRRSGADVALLSPVFVTASHPDRAALGVDQFLAIARRAAIPVYALGGVNAGNAERLAGANVAGIAAIAALIPD